MIEIREYLDPRGRSPYAQWFDRLSAQAAAKIAVAVTRSDEHGTDPGFQADHSGACAA